MKLNKKIVAGLATAALFTPLALNNVQVNASVSNSGDTAIDKGSNQHITKQQVIDALKQADVGADEGTLNNNIPNNLTSDNIKNIANFTNDLNNLDSNKDDLSKGALTKNNTNDFIPKGKIDSGAFTTLSDISSINGDIQNINKLDNDNSLNDNDIKSQLTNLFNNKNTEHLQLNSSAANDHVSDVANHINDLANYYNSSDYSSKNTDAKVRELTDGKYSSLISITGGLNSTSLNDNQYDNEISNFFKNVSDISENSNKFTNVNNYKSTTIKDKLNSKSLNGDAVDGHVSNIVTSISSINDFHDKITNLSSGNNKNDLLTDILKDNNVKQDKTGINIDDDNKATTVANKLTELYNESNKSPSSAPTYQAPVVITNDNNSNSNNTNQSSKPTETNNSHEVQFPSAPKSDNVVKDSHATKVNNAKADVKKAEKQLSNAKSNKAKNNAVKSINKAKANLAKLNGDQKSTLKDAKKSVKKAEKQVKKAKTSDARKSATTSLKAAQTNYTQLNKYIK